MSSPLPSLPSVRYVVIPYTDQPGVEHKYAITLYSDFDHVFEKINPQLNCEVCTNPNGIGRVQSQLDALARVSDVCSQEFTQMLLRRHKHGFSQAKQLAIQLAK